jgi:peroxiredoxin
MISFKKILPVFLFSFFIQQVMAQPRQGMMAGEIALPTVEGDTLKLSSFKGKVVLIDFWASWCAPCRVTNRGLTKLYPKYKDKGFEIFAVSLDDDPEKWKKAMKQDKVTWPQVNDNGGWESSTVQQWNLFAIPTSYLMDKDGRLIAMDLEKKELEKALKELLDK